MPLDADGQGIPYATYGFAAQIAEVEVDIELGTVKLLRIVAAHDVGRAINPTLVEGQIQGGIAQGIGMALMEEYLPGRTENLHDYLIPTIGDVPEIECILIEDREPLGPYGAKGVGEPALVPTAPAILGAIRHATGRARAPACPRLPHRAAARRMRAGTGATPMSDDSRRLRAPASGNDGHRALRCLPGAVPHPPRPRRRLRPLRQRRRRAGARRPAGAADAHGPRLAADGALRRRREDWDGELGTGASGAFVTGIGAGTTYPDYKPAPFIVASKHDGVDMVTVVTEGIFSYCGVKVKIDTDRYLGPEQAAVRVEGEAVGHVTTAEYGSQMLSLGGVHHLTGGSQAARAASPATRCWRSATAGGRARDRRRRRRSSCRPARAPIVNGVRGAAHARRLRLAPPSASSRQQWHGHVDEVIVVDDHITGVLSEHQAGKFLDMPPTGIRVRGRTLDARPLFPGRPSRHRLGRHRHHRPAGDHREHRSEDRLARPAPADGLAPPARIRLYVRARRGSCARCRPRCRAPVRADRRAHRRELRAGADAPCCSWPAPAARCAPASPRTRCG